MLLEQWDNCSTQGFHIEYATCGYNLDNLAVVVFAELAVMERISLLNGSTWMKCKVCQREKRDILLRCCRLHGSEVVACACINDLCLVMWKVLEESHLSMPLYVTLYASSVTSSVAYSDSQRLRCLWC